jgi:thiol:disulfide interchange protein DsbD
MIQYSKVFFKKLKQMKSNLLKISLLFALLILQPVKANDFLPPEKAFQYILTVHDSACIENCLVDINVKVADGYYLYRERFALQNPMNLPLWEFLELPRGEKKFDEFLKQDIEALRGEMNFQIRYSLGDKTGSNAMAVMISQGCADAGFCYPPMNTPVLFESSDFLSGVTSLFDKNSANDLFDGKAPIAISGGSLPPDESGDLAMRLAVQSWMIVLPVFFGLGLLLAFTPCTLPMLPIVSSLVVGQRADLNSTGYVRPTALALVYVMGMAFSYALLGVIAGLTGQSLVIAMQQPIVLWFFGVVLALLGIFLLMGYTLQLPARLQSWFHQKTGHLKGGQFLPVLIMGVLSALLLGPCVAPPLAGALLYIGQTGDAVLGGSALFVFALGMGLPLVLFVAGAGSAIPKVGPWMNWVSLAFGFVLLALSVWTITPVTPVRLIMAAWALLACIVASTLFYGAANNIVAMDAREKVLHGRDHNRFNKSNVNLGVRGKVLANALGLMFSLIALIYLMGFFSGSSSLLQPLSGTRDVAPVGAVVSNQSTIPYFERVSSKNVMAFIASSSQPVMLDFYADWCVSCKEFELFTLTNDAVRLNLNGLRLVKVDLTENTEDDRNLLKQFNLFGPPAILFFSGGQVEVIHKVIGFQDAERFNETLLQVRPSLGL